MLTLVPGFQAGWVLILLPQSLRSLCCVIDGLACELEEAATEGADPGNS